MLFLLLLLIEKLLGPRRRDHNVRRHGRLHQHTDIHVAGRDAALVEDAAEHGQHAERALGQGARVEQPEVLQVEGAQRLGRADPHRQTPQSDHIVLQRREPRRHHRLHLAEHGRHARQHGLDRPSAHHNEQRAATAAAAHSHQFRPPRLQQRIHLGSAGRPGGRRRTQRQLRLVVQRSAAAAAATAAANHRHKRLQTTKSTATTTTIAQQHEHIQQQQRHIESNQLAEQRPSASDEHELALASQRDEQGAAASARGQRDRLQGQQGRQDVRLFAREEPAHHRRLVELFISLKSNFY